MYANDESKWGPQLALTPSSSTNTGYWHSGGEKQPWIEFRMAEETEVDRIKIIDRLDCCPERFENVEVRVGLKWSANSVSCGVQSYSGSTIYIFNCPANARGNHISITKYGTTTNWFHINNVEVYKRIYAGELDPDFWSHLFQLLSLQAVPLAGKHLMVDATSLLISLPPGMKPSMNVNQLVETEEHWHPSQTRPQMISF